MRGSSALRAATNPQQAAGPGSSASGNSPSLSELDAVLFTAPWVLIAEDNTSPARVPNLLAAQRAVAAGRARSVAGRVRPGVLAADIDPIDGHAVLGDACAEALVSWCVGQGVPYLVRESGRSGGRHVISVSSSPRHRIQWRNLCARLSRQYRIDVDDRSTKTLRLLTAPHRRALYSRVITCTLTPAVVRAACLEHTPATPGTRFRHKQFTTDHRRDTSRSAREYGELCAMARAGYNATEAWQAVAVSGSKAFMRGLRWWHRYQWLPAVTTVAAERGMSEADAWSLAQQACPARYLRITRGWWRGLWRRAVAEASVSRPRRRRLGTASEVAGVTSAEDVTRLQNELASAAADVLPTQGVRPQRLDSAVTVLFHLAPVLLSRGGSISVRDLAERTRMDTKTVRAALSECVRTGLLVLVHRYAGGSNDCSSYGVGRVVQGRRGQTSLTSCSTPATPHGRAHLPRLRSQHRRDRRHWRLRCDALATLAPGERLATSTSPAAKLLRSLHHQRQWLQSLTTAELARRRSARRRVLNRLDVASRTAWLEWLVERKAIVEVVESLYTKAWRKAGTSLLGAVPNTIHRGLREGRWRFGSQSSPVPVAAPARLPEVNASAA